MKKPVKLMLILLVILIISFYIDKFILDLIKILRIDVLNSFFIFFAKYFDYYILALVITIISMFKNNKIKNFLKLWSSFLSAGLLVYILKILVQRPRPLINLIEASNSSFPSGHTTIMFALFPIICKNFKEIRYFWLFISILVAFSRIYLGVHHLSDIMGGIILGLLVGINIINLFNHKLIK
ncbi:phosphatase PAP2 family protein [Candidatus Woesearchaeota archaeon]|nr:phosphatase PAP2 family protein [Candidatus Woesearchaeota archaeon]